MDQLNLVLRMILGAVLIAAGIDKWSPILAPQQMLAPGLAFREAMSATGYFMEWVGSWEILVGFLILHGAYLPLALILLAPLTLNFLAFHLFLDLPNLASALIVFIVQIHLMLQNRKSYALLLTSLRSRKISSDA